MQKAIQIEEQWQEGTRNFKRQTDGWITWDLGFSCVVSDLHNDWVYLHCGSWIVYLVTGSTNPFHWLLENLESNMWPKQDFAAGIF